MYECMILEAARQWTYPSESGLIRPESCSDVLAVFYVPRSVCREELPRTVERIIRAVRTSLPGAVCLITNALYAE